MSIVMQTIAAIRQSEKYSDKSRLLYLLTENLAEKKAKLTPADRKDFSRFLFEEVDALLLRIPEVQSYKEKDFLFEYESRLLRAVIACHPSSDELSEEQKDHLERLVTLVEKERFLENMINEIFSKKKNDPENVNYMLAMTGLARDEYHKGKLYQGLLHYQQSILKLPEESRDLIGAHIQSEMTRYLESPFTVDIENNLELICDVCRYFGKDRFEELLKQVLWIGNASIRFYAMATLLVFNSEVPESIIRDLASDAEYACLTYGLLRKYRKEKLFPAEFAYAEYLAQSDLSRWLTYPSELGMLPDEIEYVGRVRKNGFYYIFRFRSNSDNLSEELRGEWLIGWSGPHGSTFSNFDVYNDYAQETTEKTLKYIKKKLL